MTKHAAAGSGARSRGLRPVRASTGVGVRLCAGVLALGVLSGCRASPADSPAASALAAAPIAPARPGDVDGRIAFVSERDGNAEVYLYDGATAAARRLTRREGADYPASGIPGTPDLLVLSAEASETPRESLWRYVADADTLRPLRLTSRTLRNPVVGRDGRTLVFEADFASVRDLYRYDLATDAVERLTDHPLGNFDPALSPDGSRIAFASSREGQAELYTMPRTGEGTGGASAVRLTAFHTDDWAPRWSPDGRWIAFLSGREGDVARLFLVAPDGTGLRRLLADGDTLGTSMQEQEAVWSPDGHYVAFEVLPTGGGAQLWVSEVATGRRWRVADALGSATQPSWSPDSGVLVLSGMAAPTDEDAADLYIVRRNGSGLARLTDAPGADWLPRWLE